MSSSSGNGAFKSFFKKSALAAKADKVWSESKHDYSAANPANAHNTHLEKKSLGEVLGKLSAKKKEEDEIESNSNVKFVFGSKINDRVVKKANEDSASLEEAGSSQDGVDLPQKSAAELFKTAASAQKPEEDTGSNQIKFRAEAQEAAERAKEVEKQHASTSVVPLTTGEEADKNIFQASCKLHAFDTERRQFVEKGVCTLRINERMENGQVHHRIVARTSGTLRVVINSKIFADMLVERVDRRVKISAMGPEATGVQIFLLKFGFSKTDTGAETDQFYAILSDILKLEKGEHSRKRKADCDLNAENVKLREKEEDEEEGYKEDDDSKTEETAKNEEEPENLRTDKSVEDAEKVAQSEAEDSEKLDEGFVLLEKPDGTQSFESQEHAQ